MLPTSASMATAHNRPPYSVCPTRLRQVPKTCSRPCAARTSSCATDSSTQSGSSSGYRGSTKSTGKSLSSTAGGYVVTLTFVFCGAWLNNIIKQLGLPVDNLIGLSAHDPYFQPTHHRRNSSSTSSPSTSIALPLGAHAVRTSPSVAIPRPPSQIHRPPMNVVSGSTTPLSHSPSSASDSPYLSPSLSTHPASFATAATTPPSSSAPRLLSSAAQHQQPLSYPSVPPPSLSSSYAGPDSPVELRGSRWRHGSIHELREASRSASRHRSVERGARVAETGQLIPRSRAGSIVPGINNNATPPPAPAPTTMPASSEVGPSTS